MKKLGSFLVSIALLVGSIPLLVSADEAEATLPDLTASNLTLIEYSAEPGTYIVEVDYANEGEMSVDPSTAGHNEGTLNGTLVTAYNWTTLADLDFLTAGDESQGVRVFASVPAIVDGDVIEACVDSDDDVEESDESNNCVSVTFDESEEEGLPDLTASNLIFTENSEAPGTYTVTVDYANQGTVDVEAETDGGYNLGTVNETESHSAYTWANLNPSVLDFLNAGGETLGARGFASSVELTNGDVVEVCIDAGEVVEESDESNNCVSREFTTSSGDDDDDDDDDDDAPTITVEAGADQSVTAGYALTLDNEAYVENLSGGDEPTVTIDWGDGSALETATLVISNPIYVQGTHIYETATLTGTPNVVTICAYDMEDGEVLGTACDSFNLTVDSVSSGGGGGSSNSSHNKPDLSVENIYIQSDGDIIAVIENEGEKDVSDSDEVRVEVYIDGDTEWGRDYEQSSSDNFLDEGEDSEINMGELLEDDDEEYEIEVCVDTEDEVEEIRESNNCRTENLSVDDDAVDSDDDDDDDDDDTVTLYSEGSDDDDDDNDEDCDEFFYDTDGHWAEEEICDLYDRDVVEGRKRHYYVPNDDVTRAEFLKIALLNSGLDVESVSSGDDYSDVDDEDWFYDYVTFATDLGIVDGYEGKFYPNQSITRAEAMAILVRLELDGDDLDELLDEDLDDSDIDFDDVDDHDWFAAYIVYGDEEGIIEGYSNDTFRPENRLTRAEAAEIADNLYDTRY